jgi:hypothetical protein
MSCQSFTYCVRWRTKGTETLMMTNMLSPIWLRAGTIDILHDAQLCIGFWSIFLVYAYCVDPNEILHNFDIEALTKALERIHQAP